MISKENVMVKDLRKAILVVLTMAALLTACTPASTTTPELVQAQVATSVAATVQSQNDMAASVAQTLTAQAPLPSATPSVTPIPLNLPTADPSLATVTPFVVVPPSNTSSGGGSDPAPAQYACSWREVKPRTNVFNGGVTFDVQWVITNTGTKNWGKPDLNYISGTKLSSFLGEELPATDPGDSVTVNFEATSPTHKGLYGMQFRVQGNMCFPALTIQVGSLRDP
jgi:hypothetical protein